MRTTVTIVGEGAGPSGDIVRKIRAADESLRKSFAGLAIDEVAPEVERSMTELGIDLPESEVREYARRIADRADYELVLR